MVNKATLSGRTTTPPEVKRRAHNKIDLKGRKFGRLTVIREIEQMFFPSGSKTQWECKCECGNNVNVLGSSLTTGNTKSCGCLQRELVAKRSTTHGMTGTKVYRTWQALITRCTNEKIPGFKNYGGRGIIVCERWMKFENFLDDLGLPPPGMSLDRINNEGNYCPDNCRWATRVEQAQNTRSNRNICFNGETLCLAAWARKLDMDQASMGERIDNWPIEKALTEPKQRCSNVKSM